jgi:hypothetical protein
MNVALTPIRCQVERLFGPDENDLMAIGGSASAASTATAPSYS